MVIIDNLQRPLYLAADFDCELLQKRSETNKSMRAGDNEHDTDDDYDNDDDDDDDDDYGIDDDDDDDDHQLVDASK